FADTLGRRRSIVIGLALLGVGFILEGAIPRFETILVATVIWGIGYTFKHGADVAWVADEIGEEAAGAAYLRASQVAQAGALLGIVGSVFLASVRLNLPI